MGSLWYMSWSLGGIFRPNARALAAWSRFFRRYKKKKIAPAMRARPATPPTTLPAIVATFFGPGLTLEPGDAAVGELGIPTVTVVVITPLVAVVEASWVELASLPAMGVATISPDAALAPQPIKYAPYKGSKKLAS